MSYSEPNDNYRCVACGHQNRLSKALKTAPVAAFQTVPIKRGWDF